MAPKFYTGPKRTLPSSGMNPDSCSGFTTTELLIGMALLAVVMAISFSLFQSSNRLVESDTGRIVASQNAQTALDIMSNDLRQAGENLELDLGVSGVEFDSSAQRLIIRRSIPPMTASQVGSAVDMISRKPDRLNICNVVGSRIQVIGAKTGTTATSSCTYNPRPNGDDAKVYTWRVFFASQGNAAQAALLYRPPNGGTPAAFAPVLVRSVGAVEPNTAATVDTRKIWVQLASTVPTGFSDLNGSLLILIDQRRYWIQNNDLKLGVAGQTDDEAQTVAFDVESMSLSASLTDPATTVTSLAINGPWKRLQSLTAKLKARNSGLGRTNARSFEATVFPRNISSEPR